jgi:uncharacterized protein with GYD domain
METFFMFGKYSSESMKQISRERTREVLEIVAQHDGDIKDMYALLGAYDLILIAQFPDMKRALKASVDITRATGITFSTLPAIPVAEFDELVGRKG